MSDYKIREMGISERINDDQGNPIVYPMEPVCRQCACDHDRWIRYERPLMDPYAVYVCLKCDHRWTERTLPLSDVQW